MTMRPTTAYADPGPNSVVSIEDLNFGERPRMDMNVARLGDHMANLDALHPRMINDVVDKRARLRVRFQHLPHQRPASPRVQIIDRGREGRRGGGGYRSAMARRGIR